MDNPLEHRGEIIPQKDLEYMKEAIAWAERCNPIDDRIPKVGAIIAVGDVTIGRGHRGSGGSNDDDHAEFNALAQVSDRNQLPKATVYTTLEPCTGEVRSDPLTCCTELLHKAGVKKVFIGILDPNQGVTGKGLWELQTKGIEVELFPHDLAKRIRAINYKFINEQQTLGIRITSPTDGQVIRTYDRDGIYALKGTFLNSPGADVFALVSDGTRWWPQPYPLLVTAERKWSVKAHFGHYGPHTLSIVRVNELGATLIHYYRTTVSQNVSARKGLRQYAAAHNINPEDLIACAGGFYSSIEMARLPKGIQLQAQVGVIVEEPPENAQ